jgi:hypothetical protein
METHDNVLLNAADLFTKEKNRTHKKGVYIVLPVGMWNWAREIEGTVRQLAGEKRKDMMEYR